MSMPLPSHCVEIFPLPPLEAKVFVGYIYHYKILPENIFDLILKNKMDVTGFFFVNHEKYL